VIGDESELGGEIEISPNTVDLYTGWDMGAAVNHSAGIMEKRIINVNGKELSSWSVVSSFTHIGEEIGIRQLATEMQDEMRRLEDLYAKKFEWTHYTDDTALTVWRPSSESFDFLEVMVATGGEIEMTGVPKPAGSVRARVQLMRRLLLQRRLWVAGRCQDVIEMLENLKKGSTNTEYVEWNKWKHVFDWISYILFMECAEELALEANRPRSLVSAGPAYVSI
jgi:hypothetical protein